MRKTHFPLERMKKNIIEYKIDIEISKDEKCRYNLS